MPLGGVSLTTGAHPIHETIEIEIIVFTIKFILPPYKSLDYKVKLDYWYMVPSHEFVYTVIVPFEYEICWYDRC